MLEYLARNPNAGDLIKGAGGLRKVRMARRSGGKRGGARVIYYLHNEKLPLLLLMIYAKADKEDLSANQAKRLKKWVDEIIDELS
jgi:hypothetical protein